MNKKDYEIILESLQNMNHEDAEVKNLIEKVELFIDKYTIEEKYDELGKRFDAIVKGENNGKEK